jgi:hypothetical protein
MFPLLLLLMPLDAMGKPGMLLLLLPLLAIIGIVSTVVLVRRNSQKKHKQTAI